MWWIMFSVRFVASVLGKQLTSCREDGPVIRITLFLGKPLECSSLLFYYFYKYLIYIQLPLTDTSLIGSAEEEEWP